MSGGNGLRRQPGDATVIIRRDRRGRKRRGATCQPIPASYSGGKGKTERQAIKETRECNWQARRL